MTESKFDLSVAVSSFNRDDKIRKTIERLFASDASGFGRIEVVIIDDGSPRPVENAVRGLDVPSQFELRIVRTENAGIGAARNRGFREAASDLVLFLDDDVLLEKDTLNKIRYAHAAEPCGFIFGSYPFITHESESLRRFASKLYGYDQITETPTFEHVDGVTSGLLSIRKSKLGKMEKLYRDDLRIPAAEEHELIYRFDRTGQKAAHARHIFATHNHHLELRWIADQQYKYGQATAEAMEKYPGITEMPKFAELYATMEGSSARGLKRLAKSVLASRPGRKALLHVARAIQKIDPRGDHDLIFGLLTSAYFRGGYTDGPGKR